MLSWLGAGAMGLVCTSSASAWGGERGRAAVAAGLLGQDWASVAEEFHVPGERGVCSLAVPATVTMLSGRRLLETSSEGCRIRAHHPARIKTISEHWK